jgi:hypothetical protein
MVFIRLHDPGTVLGSVSVLDFFGYFVFLEHRIDGQNRIKTIFDHFRNTHARYVSEDSACVVKGDPRCSLPDLILSSRFMS